MLYAKEIVALLGAWPGREFKMGEIIRYIDPNAVGSRREAIRKSLRIALKTFRDEGFLKERLPEGRGGFAIYSWVQFPLSLQSGRNSGTVTPEDVSL